MSDLESKEQNDFMIERIKARPVNKKKLIRRTIITAAMAVIFGLIACVTFLVLEPVISNWLYPEEDPQVVEFPEDREEMSPEEMLAENIPTESPKPEEQEGEVILEEEQIQEILSEVSLNLENYKQLYDALTEYMLGLNRYMVTITAVTSNVDWFNNVQESSNQTSGVIVAENGREVLILADYTDISAAERLVLTFFDGYQVESRLKMKDDATSLAVLSVELADLSPEMLENGIPIAELGSSVGRRLTGTPVVAVGSPMGSSNSVGYGIITSSGTQFSVPDRNYKLLLTDINGSQNGSGVLFNMQNQIVGIITNGKTGTDMKNMIYAYGITELKKTIEKMSNGSRMAYMGITGVDVTSDANRTLGVPFGAYVKELEMDSPAMLAGIQQGDVITEVNDEPIISFNEYTNFLMQKTPGETVNLTVMRQSQEEYKEMNFSIELGEVE